MAFKIIINHHHYSPGNELIIEKLNKMAEKDQEILDIVNDIKASTVELIAANENTAADLDRLIASVESGNVSQAVIDDLKVTRDNLKGAVAAAKAVSEKVPEPNEPPVVEPPITEPPVEEPPVVNPPVDENGNPI